MDSRNEKRAAAVRSRPTSSPAVMVIPEREVPGISASAWAKAITATRPALSRYSQRVYSQRVCGPRASAYHSSRPNRMVAAAITSGERR